MQIKYTQHIEKRLNLRKIDYELPKRIFEQSEERYFDKETGHLIATKKVEIYNKNREVMVVYVIEEDYAKLLTIHPLKERQKKNRIETGRWRRI